MERTHRFGLRSFDEYLCDSLLAGAIVSGTTSCVCVDIYE